ncbi:Major facilitator superfamily [Carpediemonas membranifera]|uniref:Major facilitator superfamily n=1 Tax=Carpediemonas membranifera TaxID=201153 RepID=A0A8J6E2C8_9EUKA|nr:Major facilitator superfamily [Carpediemonas membranifera]|eukprot:KAG9394166.1 Major facilitator superfamily [Carpediemonas membranifera]
MGKIDQLPAPIKDPYIDNSSDSSVWQRARSFFSSASESVAFKGSQTMLYLQKGLTATTGRSAAVSYQRNFNLPDSELPVAEFTCRLFSAKENVVRGILSMSENYVCFQATSPFEQYRFKVPMSEIVGVCPTYSKSVLLRTKKAVPISLGEFSGYKAALQKIWAVWCSYRKLNDPSKPVSPQPAKPKEVERPTMLTISEHGDDVEQVTSDSIPRQQAPVEELVAEGTDREEELGAVE